MKKADTKTPPPGGPGFLSGGTWKAPPVAPDAGHAGSFGGVVYGPNGDLYLFYDTGTVPNENLKGVIRRSAISTWTAESTVGSRLRTAHLYFNSSGQPYLASETGGSAFLYTSSNYTGSSVTWDLVAYFPDNDGNPDGYGAYEKAFLVADGGNLQLYYSYLTYNAVTGASRYGLQTTFQTGGTWPANGTLGTLVDQFGMVTYGFFPHGVQGAYPDGAGNVLALSSHAYTSNDHGVSFTKILSGGSADVSLDGVSGASQSPNDNSIVVGNLYQDAGVSRLAVWRTADYGANFTKLVSVAAGGTSYRARIAAVSNLIVAAVSVDGGSGESKIYEMHSYDTGGTWTAPAVLVDATAGGNPGYTFSDFNLTADRVTGKVALAYGLLSGSILKGTYLTEFY